jgi:hypothetical protein
MEFSFFKCLQNIIRFFGPKTRKHYVLKKMSELSCYSKMLAEVFPQVTLDTHLIPEFILTDPCVGECSIGKFFIEH